MSTKQKSKTLWIVVVTDTTNSYENTINGNSHFGDGSVFIGYDKDSLISQAMQYKEEDTLYSVLIGKLDNKLEVETVLKEVPLFI